MTAIERASSRSSAPAQPPAPAVKRRPRRPSLSHETFLDKALDLFLEKGFERTSIEVITASVGMAKRTVYLRYGDKTTLFKAALKRAIEEWIVPIERLRAAECESLEDSLLAIGQILVDNILSPAGLRLLRLTNAEASNMPDIGAFNVREGTEPTIAFLTDLFRRRGPRQSSAIFDAEDAATAFMDIVVGGPAHSAAWGVNYTQAAIDHHTRYSVHLFLRGLLQNGRDPAEIYTGTIEDENLRLKRLLADALLALDQAQERLKEFDGPDKLEIS